MHVLANIFLGLQLADANSSAALKAALIGGLALVIAAAVPALASRKEHEPRAVRDARLLMESDRRSNLRRINWLEAYVDNLEAELFTRQVDPRKFKPPGEQP
jgi:hypothetical protein